MTSRVPSFRLLGALEIEGVEQALGGPKQQAMLAFLLFNAGRAVPTSELVDAVWGDEPPATADAIVHGYVRRIRTVLTRTQAVIRSEALGYRLDLPDDEALDTNRFADLVADGTAALREGRPSDAEARLREALDLWRGEPMRGLPESAFVIRTRTRLESAHAAAALSRIEAALALGESRLLVPELEALAADRPYDESITRLLMLALVRSGGQAAALSAYRELRRRLAEDLGVEPSSGLQELEAAVLRQDPSLLMLQSRPRTTQRAAMAPDPDSKQRSRGGRSVVLVAALTALIILVAAVRLLSPPPSGPSATSRTLSSVVSIEPSVPVATLVPVVTPGPIVASWKLPQPSCCGVSGETAWGVGHHDDMLREIDVATNQMVDRGAIAGYQSGIPQLLAGSVWIPSARGPLVRFDPVAGQVQSRIDVTASSVVFGYLDVWITTRDHHLDRISLESNGVAASIAVAAGPNDWDDGLTIGGQAVWDSIGDTGELVKVDPSTNAVVDRIRGFGDTYSGAPIAFDGQAVWLLRAVDQQMTLFRIDARSDRIVARVPVGSAGGGNTGTVAAAGGHVWTVTWDGALSEVDEATNKVVAVLLLPQTPQNINFGAGALWVDGYDANVVWRVDPTKLVIPAP